VNLLTYLQCCKFEIGMGSSEPNLTLSFLLVVCLIPTYLFALLIGELRELRWHSIDEEIQATDVQNISETSGNTRICL